MTQEVYKVSACRVVFLEFHIKLKFLSSFQVIVDEKVLREAGNKMEQFPRTKAITLG